MTERPWLKNYPAGIVWDQTFSPYPVYQCLDDSVRDHPDAPHMDFFGRIFTYCETASLVARAAKGLQDLGVGPGTKVCLFMTNCPQYVISFFAILKVGGTVVNLSPLYSEGELLHQIEDSESDFLLTQNYKLLIHKIRNVVAKSRIKTVIVSRDQDYVPFWQKLKYKIFLRNILSNVTGDDTWMTFETLLNNEGNYKPVTIDPEQDIAVLQYTGGTTGLPKGAMLTHANISINVQQALAWDTTSTHGTGKTLTILPLFHAYAMTVILCGTTAMGGEMVLLPRFDAGEVIKIIQQKKITMIPAVPTMFTALLHQAETDKIDLSSVTSVVSGGAPLPEKLKSTFDQLLSSGGIREGYGLTETSPVALGNPVTGSQKINSVGLPMPATDVIFTDPDDPSKILPYGETGEICIKGPQVMKGYWKRPEATAEVLIDGRLRTGDVGYMDDEGYLFIVDRIKDLILVSGFNVYPRTVEEALYRHPAVKEVTVIGIPDDYHGEVPKAFIVLKQGQQALGKDKILNFLKDRLGSHEMPKEIEFRDNLPKTVIGKLSKKELVAEEKAKRDVSRA